MGILTLSEVVPARVPIRLAFRNTTGIIPIRVLTFSQMRIVFSLAFRSDDSKMTYGRSVFEFPVNGTLTHLIFVSL
jgi:hypothetical protein